MAAFVTDEKLLVLIDKNDFWVKQHVTGYSIGPDIPCRADGACD